MDLINSATPILSCRAIPVFTDIDLNMFNISPSTIHSAVTPKTKAILPVHLFGIPAEMDEITKFASFHPSPGSSPGHTGELLEDNLGRMIQSVEGFYS